MQGVSALWFSHARERARIPSLPRLGQLNAALWTADQKGESMDKIPQGQIIGIDVSRDWLDIHCLADGHRQRFAQTDHGYNQVVRIALDREALVCFEATGGCEWRLWADLERCGVPARQLPPAQIKAFAASRGTRAKTDRIDAELIARFMRFRPEAGRRIPAQKLQLLRAQFLGALTSKRRQLVEMRKRLLVQIGSFARQGLGALFEEMDAALQAPLDLQITELDRRIAQILASDEALAETADILRSIPGLGPVTCAVMIAEMPELGQISGEQAAALTGLAPYARDSGAFRGRRCIGGGRGAIRQILYQAALVASRHNAPMKSFAERLRNAGKPHKVIIIAIARKLVTLANALCRKRQTWRPQTE
jgi:transposase